MATLKVKRAFLNGVEIGDFNRVVYVVDRKEYAANENFEYKNAVDFGIVQNLFKSDDMTRQLLEHMTKVSIKLVKNEDGTVDIYAWDGATDEPLNYQRDIEELGYILRYDHILVEFENYKGRKLRDIPFRQRKKAIDEIIESVMKMKPAPKPWAIQRSETGVTVIWYFPTPIFVENWDMCEYFDQHVEKFLQTNPISKGEYTGMSVVETDLDKENLSNYYFYKNLDIKMALEDSKQKVKQF